ncbi:hypothetical protein PACTADRAFT_32447 [Pachysolen tannophilus NRRL Y-2460]|uniref:Clu domain-containing protein n=1 Tax=Pachysolen tannophilus NRRL Y-2460 TaxID=669874 RepID=A0A1E4TZ44_PACTA|nr:hypothetical protein PACTADRAFT_32447 [Pachysolen tannophilus NRRL Y-2460]
MTEESKTEVQETIKLVVELPGKKDCITLQADLSENISGIKQVISSLPQSRQFTNFSLTFDSLKLDQSLTLSSIIELANLQDLKELKFGLKEDPYTESSIREHVVKVREYLGLELTILNNSAEGVSTGVSKFQNLELYAIKDQKQKQKENSNSKEVEEKPIVELSEDEKLKSIDSIESIFKSQEFKLHAPKQQFKLQPALKTLAISMWFPPTSNQRLKGDLLYLQAQTLEGDTFHITGNVKGFFINKSSSSKFDGSIRIIPSSNGRYKLNKSHSLLELLSALSPLLVEQLKSNIEIQMKSEPEVYFPPGNTLLSNPWIVKNPDSQLSDLGRSQANYLLGGPDAGDLLKEWNEDYQSIRELPHANFSERVLREKLLNRAGYEFTLAAVNGAVSIVKGELEPMNPEESEENRVYLRNNIFYSFGVDSTEQFKETGGNEAARAAALKDLDSIRCLNKIDANGVAHLCTVVVDYCGKRVICQTPVPGIFNQSQIQENEEVSNSEEKAGNEANDDEANDHSISSDRIVYGLTDGATKLAADKEFLKKFAPIGEAFHIKPHQVWTTDGQVKETVVTSAETKGLIGSDGRSYIIDLYRTTPLDIEFIDNHFNPETENSYPHRETTLRHEATEEWWRRQVAVAIKKATDEFESEKQKKLEMGEKIDEEVKPTFTVKPSDFALNPDAFSLNRKVVSKEDQGELEKDEQTVREVSKFVSLVLLPEYIEEVASAKIMAPIDGCHLVSVLHKRGINVRYLGRLASEVLKVKESYLLEEATKKLEIKKLNEEAEAKAANTDDKKAEDEKKEEEKEEEEEEEEKEKPKSSSNFTPTISALDSLYRIVIQEIVCRSVKHLLRLYTSSLPLVLIPSAIAHIHNCLLGDKVNGSPVAVVDEELRDLYSDSDFSFTEITPSSLIQSISNEAFIRYRYELPAGWKEELINPISLLREIAIKFGIQWESRSYAFTKEEFETTQVQSGISEVDTQVLKNTKKKGKHSNTSAVNSATNGSEVKRSTTFTPEDIICILPVVKDSIFRSSVVEEVWELGRERIQTEEEREFGLNLLVESVQFYEQIYGTIHHEVSKAYGVLAQTYFDLGLIEKACEYARKSVIISERTFGFDSFETLLSLINSAFFEAANNNISNAFVMYSRVLKEWNLIFDGHHPSIITTLSNIASLLDQHKLYKQAILVLKAAADLSSKINGEESQITAMITYQLGQNFLMDKDVPSAMEEMKKSYEIFKNRVGVDDLLTVDSKKWLDTLKAYSARLSEISASQGQLSATPATGKKNKKKGKVIQEQQPQSLKLNAKAKQQNIISVPEIANQSVEDILAFIEGTHNGGKQKNGKKTNAKK